MEIYEIDRRFIRIYRKDAVAVSIRLNELKSSFQIYFIHHSCFFPKPEVKAIDTFLDSDVCVCVYVNAAVCAFALCSMIEENQ